MPVIDAQTVLKAKEDPQKRETMIEENLEMINRYAAKAAGRWVDRHDDIYSEALIAFNDAITAYDPEKGSFSAFAARVITNRVTDCLRKQQRNQEVLPFSTLDETDEGGNVILFEPMDRDSTPSDVTWEIASLKGELGEFGISFFELPGVSPKSRKTRKACAGAVREITENPQLVQKLWETKKLPVSQLSHYGTKLLERHRKYIIAGVLICTGDYHVMAEYFKGGESQ